MGQATLVNPVTSAPAIELRGYVKRYGKLAAVDGIDLSVSTGEMHGLIGPDGSGKSSVMKAVAGVIKYDAGSVAVFGTLINTDASAERIKHRLGFMPQGLGLSLYRELSVEENIDFFARLRAVPTRELQRRKSRLLSITRLEDFRARSVKNLSGGMKQKLGLICTLVHEPELLILDEPTTGVDPLSRRDFWMILTELVQERRITVLATTAYLNEADQFDRICLIHSGKILAQGDPSSIQATVPGHVVTLQSPRQVDAYDRLRATFPSMTARGRRLRMFTDADTPEQARQRVLDVVDDLPIDSVEVNAPDLEDTFIALLRRENLVPVERGEPARPARRLVSGPFDPQHSQVAVEASKLTRYFGDFVAAADVSFSIRDGEIFGLLGPNGAGKTTVIKMLTGILKPSSGTGHVAGADVRRPGRAIKQRIGYMSQLFSLYTELTVMENIEFYAGIYGLSLAQGRERSRWIIEMAGLGKYLKMRTANLSVGMRQRLALGCALVHRPRVLFLDEPTAGVDPIGRQQFWDVLFELSRQDGVAVLVTTHYMSEAEHCDRLALMYDGKLVASDTPQAMKRDVERRAGQILQVGVDDLQRAAHQLERAGYRGLTKVSKRIELRSQTPAQDQAAIESALRAAGVPSTVRSRNVTMNDVFVYWVTELERQRQAGHSKAVA